VSFTRLGEACQKWTPGLEAQAEPLLAISGAWAAIVGSQVAQHSRPLAINGNTLVILTRSNAWTHQLSFMSRQVLQALAHYAPAVRVEKVRFRVGRVAAATSPQARSDVKRSAGSPKADLRPAAQTLAEVIARFRDDVKSSQQAKASSGWKPCLRCGVPMENGKARCCIPCTQGETEQRHRAVARLLFEAPWLGFAGIAALVEGLTERDYRVVRLKVLRRWWETLTRAERAGRLSPNGRERLIASSYVILKSGLDPERIVPAVVRNLLGDALHDLIYGTAN